MNNKFIFSNKSIFVIFLCTIVLVLTGCPGFSSVFTLESPQNLRVDNVYSDMVDLSWTAQSSGSGYIVYISTDESFSGNVQYVDVGKNNAVSISGFESSTTYYFRVTSYSYTGESSPSEIVDATTLVGAPTKIEVSFSGDNLILTWDSVKKATGYKIYYGLNSVIDENNFILIDSSTNDSMTKILEGKANKDGLYHIWIQGKDERDLSSTFAYSVKRRGTPNYKFYEEVAPDFTNSETKYFDYSLYEESTDTEVFLIKINTNEKDTISSKDTGAVTAVHENFVDNSKKVYAKFSISLNPVSRNGKINPMLQDNSKVVRLDHLPSKNTKFDLKNIKSVTPRNGNSIESRYIISDYEVGDSKRFWIDDANGKFTKKYATLIAEGEYSYVWILDDVFSYYSTSNNDNKITEEQAEEVAKKFDQIYGPETTVFGETYKDIYDDIYQPEESGLVPPEEKISILICDIYDDYSSDQSGGILGYFWAKDFFQDELLNLEEKLRSNETEIFYIDAHFLDAFTEMSYSTLAHEFQHMLNFVNKDIKWGETPSTWYNEMLSMVCEDLLQDYIGIEDKDSPRSRLPTFNYGYAYNGIKEWFNDENVLYSYAHAYAFGAFITRNYGGAELVKAIVENESVDLDSIIEAIYEVDGTPVDEETLLFEFARALCYPEAFEGYEYDSSTPLGKAYDAGLKHFYRGNSCKISGYDYIFRPICLFDYSYFYIDKNNRIQQKYGPYYFGAKDVYELRPFGISIHSFGVKSGEFTFDYEIASSEDVVSYFVIQ